jgi:NitT/TauT family transport system substrate-binding protein
MKKIIAIVLTLLMITTLMVGCGDKAAPSAEMRVAGLKGPTTMGLVKVIEDDKNGETHNDYTFTVAGTADEITPLLLKGELDFAAVPANLASVLYNRSEGEIVTLAINTLGVVYIVEKGDSIADLSDLKGKTIYATGQGSTPEYALRYILKENGIDPDKDVDLQFKSQPDEIVALLKGAKDGVAMLPQPYVTVATGNVEGLSVKIDLTKEWEKLDTDSMFITGVLVGRRSFVEENKEAVAEFLKEYKASTEYVNANVEEAAALIEGVGITKAAVAKKAIPFCNITYIEGKELKTALAGYLQVLYDLNPKAVGGKLPGDDFYYEK